MDRIREIRPLGSPHAVYVNAPRLIERLLKNAVAGPKGCIIWAGATDRDNYGATKTGGRKLRVHRAVYQLLVEPLDDTTVVDHVCHNGDKWCSGGRKCIHRRCINPYHLDAVSSQENTLRSEHSIGALNAIKEECPQGHPYDEANTYVYNGGRACRECRRAYSRAWKARRRAELAGAR